MEKKKKKKKKLNIFFSWTKKASRLNLDIYHPGLKVCQVMILGWPSTFLCQGKICSPIHFIGKCGNTGRNLHGICRYAVAVLLRWANHGPWASWFNSGCQSQRCLPRAIISDWMWLTLFFCDVSLIRWKFWMCLLIVRGLVAARCGAFFLFCPVRCLIAVLRGSFLALSPPVKRRGSSLLRFSFVCDLSTVC